jgi:hypothetical protein
MVTTILKFRAEHDGSSEGKRAACEAITRECFGVATRDCYLICGNSVEVSITLSADQVLNFLRSEIQQSPLFVPDNDCPTCGRPRPDKESAICQP